MDTPQQIANEMSKPGKLDGPITAPLDGDEGDIDFIVNNVVANNFRWEDIGHDKSELVPTPSVSFVYADITPLVQHYTQESGANYPDDHDAVSVVVDSIQAELKAKDIESKVMDDDGREGIISYTMTPGSIFFQDGKWLAEYGIS